MNGPAVIPCGTCHQPLTTAELRFLWSDIDFLYHGGHQAHVSDEHRLEYFAAMRGESQVSVEVAS